MKFVASRYKKKSNASRSERALLTCLTLPDCELHPLSADIIDTVKACLDRGTSLPGTAVMWRAAGERVEVTRSFGAIVFAVGVFVTAACGAVTVVAAPSVVTEQSDADSVSAAADAAAHEAVCCGRSPLLALSSGDPDPPSSRLSTSTSSEAGRCCSCKSVAVVVVVVVVVGGGDAVVVGWSSDATSVTDVDDDGVRKGVGIDSMSRCKAKLSNSVSVPMAAVDELASSSSFSGSSMWSFCHRGGGGGQSTRSKN
jgi:hypothetical protein